MAIRAPKKIGTRIPTPRANPLGTRRNPKGFVTGPRVPRPKQQTRIYSKAIAQQDPSIFTNSGFGDTGMSGES